MWKQHGGICFNLARTLRRIKWNLFISSVECDCVQKWHSIRSFSCWNVWFHWSSLCPGAVWPLQQWIVFHIHHTAPTVTLNILWTGSVLQLTVLIYAYAEGAAHTRRRGALWRETWRESCTLSLSGVHWTFFWNWYNLPTGFFFILPDAKCQAPLPASLFLSPPFYLQCICAQMSAHDSWLRKTKKNSQLVCRAASSPCE